MARTAYGKHATSITGTDDATKQISKNKWNEDPSKAGMLGFTPTIKTLAAGVIIPTDTITIVAAESGTADDFDLITNTEVADKDFLLLLADTGDTITVRHNQTASGSNEKIMLLGAGNKILSETVPLVLIRVGTIWYEWIPFDPVTLIGSQTINGAKTFLDTFLKLRNPANTFSLTALAGAQTADRNATHPVLTASDIYVMQDVIQDLTNKGIDISRILGFPIPSATTISTGALAATASIIVVDAEGAGVADQLDTITGMSNGDIVILLAAASQEILVNHDTAAGNDKIQTKSKVSIYLSETIPLILQRVGLKWYEIAGPRVEEIDLALGKPTDALATGDGQVVFPIDFACKVIKVKAIVETVSSSGTPTFAIRKTDKDNTNTADILSTNITIDANEYTSDDAATPPVIKSDGTENLAKGQKLKIDCDVAGTGTAGVVVTVWVQSDIYT